MAVSRRRLLVVLRWVVTLAAIAWVLLRADLAAVGSSLASLSLLGVVASTAVTALILVGMALRWRLLLQAYGSTHPPGLPWLLQLTFIGFFFNTCLPGGLGGDVVRGVASRKAYGQHGLTRGLAVVFIDRVLGVVGLLAVASVSALLVPLPGVEVLPYVATGLLVVLIAILGGLALVPRIHPRLPPLLRRVVPHLPAPVSATPLLLSLGLAVATHLGVAISGHLILMSLVPDLPFTTSLVLIPVAMATQMLPITVGGAGAREAAFVALYALVGVPSEAALAASLALFGTYLALAAIGAALPMPAAEDDATSPAR
jgi:uncharacterized membrane protein YbhN (UPF0104 family)